jgi:hypothetical protein
VQVGEDEPDLGTFQGSEIIPCRKLQRDYMEWVIRKLEGDKPLAAERVGVALRTVYNWFGGPDDESPPMAKPAR